jgi:restriction system protein
MLAPDPRFERIDGLDGQEFEAAVIELLPLVGFEQVEHVGGFDKGADILAVRDGTRTAVQAKRWSTPVDLKSVRQLVDGIHRYKCSAGLLVTNSFLTKPALECAESWDIEVWDRRILADFLEGESPTVDTTICAECGSPVSAGVTAWCLGQPARYGGAVYCMKHQARSQRRHG